MGPNKENLFIVKLACEMADIAQLLQSSLPLPPLTPTRWVNNFTGVEPNSGDRWICQCTSYMTVGKGWTRGNTLRTEWVDQLKLAYNNYLSKMQ